MAVSAFPCRNGSHCTDLGAAGRQTRTGNTPLHLAIESGHGEAAVTLLEAGADRERVSEAFAV